jgi:putative spermidine/putrescine transport system substrate-binding protein
MKIKTNRIIAVAGVVALAASALGYAGAAEAKTAKPVNKTIHVFLSADTNIQVLWEQKLVPAFVAANPGYKVDVVLDLHGAHDAQTTAKITAASITKKDPGYDVIDGGFVANLGDSALLVKPTSKLIPNLKDVPATLIDQGHGGGIPYRGSSVLLAYNSSKVTSAPKTFDDLITWIKANPGKFTYNTPASGGSGKSFVTAAVDKYTSAADRTKMANDYLPELETNWTQGFDLLASLNPYVYQKGVYPTGNAAILNLLASGEISMAPVWSDQFNTGLDNGNHSKHHQDHPDQRSFDDRRCSIHRSP